MDYEKKCKDNRAKIRKLIHLDPEDAVFIKQAAAKRKVSQSEIIRESIKIFQAAEETAYDPMYDIIGTVTAGKNQAQNHDEVLYE